MIFALGSEVCKLLPRPVFRAKFHLRAAMNPAAESFSSESANLFALDLTICYTIIVKGGCRKFSTGVEKCVENSASPAVKRPLSLSRPGYNY